jgi:hypothetical protein
MAQNGLHEDPAGFSSSSRSSVPRILVVVRSGVKVKPHLSRRLVQEYEVAKGKEEITYPTGTPEGFGFNGL